MALRLINGTCFLHIPKTGGTWVSKALHACGLVKHELRRPHKHIDLARLLAIINSGRWSSFSRFPFGKTQVPPLFCFVRHPVRWYESYYRYMAQPSVNWKPWRTTGGHWHPCMLLDGLNADDFGVFMRKVLQRRPGFVTEMFGWYHDPELVKFGRQENLRDDLQGFMHAFGLMVDDQQLRRIEPQNVSENLPISWDPGLLREVEAVERAGMLRYGYSPISEAGRHENSVAFTAAAKKAG